MPWTDEEIAGVTWDDMRGACNRAASEQGEWAGAPLPVDQLRLRIAPKYKFQGLNGFALDKQAEETDDCGIRVRNLWYSVKQRGYVYIFEEDGRVKFFVEYADVPSKRCLFLINTIGGSRAWDFDAEVRAQGKLRECVDQYKFERYVMTGTFLETSARSGVTYLFRRLRPTIAIRNDVDGPRMLATLCLHPIGYYEESFAGVMVPTDDVVAHLLLMRADEHCFWKKANHHNTFLPSSGL